MPISLLIFKEEYYYSCKQVPNTYSAPYIFGCLGSKINFFDFGYSFQLNETFPSQASDVHSPTVFHFIVMESKWKVCYWQKGSEFSISVIGNDINIWQWHSPEYSYYPTRDQL